MVCDMHSNLTFVLLFRKAMKSSISFKDTAIAFRAKSDEDLFKAYWLFRFIGNPSLMPLGKALTKIGLGLRLPIRGLVRKTVFNQFCGGETIAECEVTSEEMGAYGIGTILDYSVEGQENELDLDITASEILATIRAAQHNPNIPFCVFKPTGISPNKLLWKVSEGMVLNDEEQHQLNRVEARFEQICSAAHIADTPVFVDAEESWMQPAIDTFVTNMMRRHNKKKAIVFNTVQLYRKDRLEYLKKSYQAALEGNYFLGEKLVRGAYMEKERKRAKEKGYPSPIHDTKEDTDRSFNDSVKFCVEHLDRISFCAGTHNEESSLQLIELMKEKGLKPENDNIYFAQLYGMSDHISFNLSAHGYKVAKYVPYGPVRKVLPYLIRRAEENSSARGQTGRELKLITAERKRRKSEKK